MFVSGLYLFSPPAVSEEVYKWTDADGKVHYGDKPREQPADKIEIEKPPVPDKALEERLRQQQESLDEYDKREAARKANTDKTPNTYQCTPRYGKPC